MNGKFLPFGTFFAAVAIALASAVGGAAAQQAPTETAVFAGGCFWCVESDFDKVPGVVATVSGFTGGHLDNPTYRQVSAGGTGHLEAVRITFDPATGSYAALLDVFWHSVDPTDPGGQFCDRGESYATAVFVDGPQQRRLAEASKQAAEQELGKPVVTPILDAGPFYPAEYYHQDYAGKNPARYRFYRWNCGRDARVQELWGDAAHAGIPGHE